MNISTAPPGSCTSDLYVASYVTPIRCTLPIFTRTPYSCQVASSTAREMDRVRLSRAAVVERALALSDADGLEAVTIRRLATELGVSPMALYWHFRTKDELL